MRPEFICHPDFSERKPICVFHKENADVDLPLPDPALRNRHILFRKKLRLEQIQSARLQITADDYYKLYINGKFITQGPSPSYPSHYCYNEIDVRDALHEGENTFAVHTYYQGTVNRVWVSGDNRQMLWLSLTVNGQLRLVSDESWRVADHTGYADYGLTPKHHDTTFLEFYRSTADETDFYEPDFDDSGWGYAAIYRNADYCLQKQSTEQLVFETILPSVRERISGGLRLDFGRETVGSLRIVASGKRGDTVLIRYGEELQADGAVRYALRCGCRYEDKWELSGKRDLFLPFDYKGFRYVELLAPASVSFERVEMLARHYPFAERQTYTTDNPELKAVLQLCADTIRYGTQEVFIDCPTREKGQYLGDVSIAGRAQAILTQDTSMMKKAILDFCYSSFICPGLMAVAPASKMQEIADYSLQLPAQITWVYAMDHDLAFVKKAEPYVTGLYHYFLERTNADGLLEYIPEKWNLVDWPENLRDGYDFNLERPVKRGLHNVINAFWCGFLEAMDEYFSILGLAETGLTERVKRSFVGTFYSKEKGLFCDTPQHTHAAVHSNLLPLLFGIGTEDTERRNRMMDLLMRKKLTSMGVYMAYFALAALVRHGRRDLAETLATDLGAWKNMLAEGATATFEAWGKDQKKNTSLFHPWATAPLIVFADYARVY